IGVQESCIGEERGCMEIGRRWKSLDRVAQRPHEPSHGVAKEAVIFNDRNQLLFHHAASGSSPEPALRAAQECRRFAWDHLIWVNSATSATLVPHKLWLMGEENCRSAPKKAAELCQWPFRKNDRRVLSG